MQVTLVETTAAPDVRDPGRAPENFDWIVRQHQKPIYRILLSLLRDSDEADVLTQECFLRAFEKLESFRGDSSMGTWLVRIAINLAHDHAKNRRQAFWKRLIRGAMPHRSETPDLHRSPEQLLLAREQVAAVWAAVAELPDQQQTVFVLRFAEEMSLEEIAKAMNLEVGTIKSHLSRAVGVVKQHLLRSGDWGQRAPE